MREFLNDATAKRFFVLFAIFFVFYFTELSNFSLSIDEESAAIRTNAAVWLGQGRWTIFLLEQYVVTQPSIPYFPILAFGGLGCAAYLLLSHCFHADFRRHAATFPLFIAFPTTFFIMDFSANIVGFGIGLLAASACLFWEAARPRTALSFLIKTSLVAVAVGSYQTFLLFVLVGYAGLFLQRLVDEELSAGAVLRYHLGAAAVVLAGAGMSEAICWAGQLYFGLPRQYLDRLINPGLIVEQPIAVLRRLFEQYRAIYSGDPQYYGYSYLTIPALMTLGVISLISMATTASGRVLVLAYTVGLTLLPFSFTLLSGIASPLRTLVAAPLVLWLLATAAVRSPSRLLMQLSALLAGIVVLQFLYTYSTLQAGKQMVVQHDRHLASQLYERIGEAIPNFDRDEVYPIDIFGSSSFTSVFADSVHSTMSGSFFSWDRGNIGRMLTYMRIAGYSNLKPVDADTRKRIYPVWAAMPVWPAEGSVRFNDGVVMVRLGKEAGYTHANISVDKPVRP